MNVTLIMISNYDPFKRDRMVYTIENHCIEEPDLLFEDGVKTLFLYAYGKKGTENKQLADLLRFLADSRKENVTNADIETIQIKKLVWSRVYEYPYMIALRS